MFDRVEVLRYFYKAIFYFSFDLIYLGVIIQFLLTQKFNLLFEIVEAAVVRFEMRCEISPLQS